MTGSGRVTVFATGTGAIIKRITLNGLLANVAITPSGATAYVVNDVFEPSTKLGKVIPISTATNEPGKAIRVGITPTAIAISP